MWDRLTPLDTAFLDWEDEERHTSLAIATVAVLEGPPPTHEEFLAALGSRLPLLPRYRQRLRTVPFDLGRPVWADDTDFDLRYHVRRTALPAPGDDAALSRLIARVMSQRLDRDRPLWECWVAEGLAGGRWAVLSKVHHCMADGVTGMDLYDAFFDDTPQPEPRVLEDGWVPEPGPSTARLASDAVRELALNPVEQVRMLARAARTPEPFLRRVYDTGLGAINLVRSLAPATPSSLTGTIGTQRRYAIGRASLAEVARVAHTFEVSINDVMLTAVSGAYRQLLLARGEAPEAQAIRSVVPVSVRAPSEDHEIANRISLMLAVLPTAVADPVERLGVVHQQMLELKASKAAEAGEALTTLATHEPFPPISWGIRLASRLPQRSIVTVTTNVPGPRRPRYALGRRVVEIFPFIPIAVRLRTGVAIMSYCDQIAVGVTADFTSAVEPETLIHTIEDDLAHLAHAAEAKAARPAATPTTAADGPKPPAKAAPKAASKAAPKATPKAAPKATPKATPKAAPKATPKAASKAASTAASKAAPKATAAGGAGGTAKRNAALRTRSTGRRPVNRPG